MNISNKILLAWLFQLATKIRKNTHQMNGEFTWARSCQLAAGLQPAASVPAANSLLWLAFVYVRGGFGTVRRCVNEYFWKPGFRFGHVDWLLLILLRLKTIRLLDIIQQVIRLEPTRLNLVFDRRRSVLKFFQFIYLIFIILSANNKSKADNSKAGWHQAGAVR